MPEMLRAREAFAYTDKNGIPRVVTVGQEVYADDPGVRGREHLFEAADARLQRARVTETASAAPGELRSVAKKAPAKKAAPKVVDDTKDGTDD